MGCGSKGFWTDVSLASVSSSISTGIWPRLYGGKDSQMEVKKTENQKSIPYADFKDNESLENGADGCMKAA